VQTAPNIISVLEKSIGHAAISFLVNGNGKPKPFWLLPLSIDFSGKPT
jgi:hypothetical protein